MGAAVPDAITAMVAAGYPAVRAGLAALLGLAGGLSIVGAGDTEAPDVIVVDTGSTSDDALDELLDFYPGSRFVLVGGDPADRG